jgi:hypothetical protein
VEKTEEVNRIRVQVEFLPDGYAELTQLQDMTGLSSRADTVRYALRTLQWITNELNDGAEIIVDKDGKQQRVIFPFILKKIPMPITV